MRPTEKSWEASGSHKPETSVRVCFRQLIWYFVHTQKVGEIEGVDIRKEGDEKFHGYRTKEEVSLIIFKAKRRDYELLAST